MKRAANFLYCYEKKTGKNCYTIVGIETCFEDKFKFTNSSFNMKDVPNFNQDDDFGRSADNQPI